VDGTVSRESDPEETNRDEDAADLTHDKPGFRSNVTILLDLLECEPIQTHQFFDQKRARYDPHLFQNGCVIAARTMPKPIPRKLNPINPSLNP